MSNDPHQNLQVFTQNNLAQLKPGSTIKSAHLENLNWSELSLNGITFENCLFTNNRFASSEFEDLYAYRCRFMQCHFQRSKFNESTFDHCIFYDVKANQGSDFSYSNLKFSKFLDCDLSQANFKYADLFGINIKACKIIAGQFEQANFCNKVSSKVMFAQAEITDSILRFARCSKLYLASCKLSGNDFTEADFTHTNLENADLKNCILNETSFVQASLVNAEIQNSEINNIDLNNCQLKGLTISVDQTIPFLHLFGIEVE